MDDLAWLMAQQRFGIVPGLERVRALLARLGNPQDGLRVVLVGGTNGKGSTAALLAAMRQATGLRTARFTSPHLTYFRERFTVGGKQVSEEALAGALGRVRPHAEATSATFFEIVTALGCVLFAEAGAEEAVMEVGLGGRLDATNALYPVLSIVSSVALDHTDILGDTVEEIARDKAQILRPGRPAFTGVTGEALTALRAEAAAIGARLQVLGEDFRVEVGSSRWDGLTLALEMPGGSLALTTPLLGRHQAANVALAAAAARALGSPDAAIRAGAAGVRWPGRLEVLPYQGRTFILDGAHNPAAAQALAGALTELGAAPLTLVLGVGQDKDAGGVAAALAPLAAHVVLTRASLSPRAYPPENLWRFFPEGEAADTPDAALEQALSATPPGGRVLVAGSLYLVGEVRPLLLGDVGEDTPRWQ